MPKLCKDTPGFERFLYHNYPEVRDKLLLAAVLHWGLKDLEDVHVFTSRPSHQLVKETIAWFRHRLPTEGITYQQIIDGLELSLERQAIVEKVVRCAEERVRSGFTMKVTRIIPRIHRSNLLKG